jgi:aerobic-type carbon monoxide dehydrogenase small subunit (CoxS/CutS family)
MAARRLITLTVNGKLYSREVEPRLSLVDFLRDELSLPGTHVGCEHGVCGACTVRMNGATVRACLLFAVQANGAELLTVEGLAGADGQLHPLQEAFWTHHGLQCGFCTPGMLLSALELLEEDPRPSAAAIRVGISGNLCMCTGYVNIVKAVQSAARVLRGEPALPPGPEAGD